MAYGTRWSVETTNTATGETVTVSIRERDYSGSITELDPGGELVTIRYTPIGMFSGTPHWTMAASEATVEFIDDGTGLLIDLLSGDDEKYQIRIDRDNTDIWYGFVVPDSYKFTPYSRDTAEFTASDRLGTLTSAAYLQSTGYKYTGQASMIEVIANCLSPIASGLYFSTYMNWYPYIGTNDLDSSDNPLENIYVDQEIFYDDDGNPYSCGYVLEQVCGRFLLQLFQSGGRWYFAQRRRALTSDQYTVFNYLNTGAQGSPSTSALDAVLSIDGATNRLVQPRARGTVPYGSVSTTYFHGNTFADQFANLSFEDVLAATIKGTTLVQGAANSGNTLRVDGITTTANIPAGTNLLVDGLSNMYTTAAVATVTAGEALLTLTANLESTPADNAPVTFLEDLGNWEYDATSGFPVSSPLASDGGISLELDVDFETTPFTYETDQYVRQRSREQVAGGSGYRIKGGWDVNVPNLDDVTTELYMAFRMYIDVGGTPYYYKWSDSTWTTTDTINEVPLKSFNLGNNHFEPFTFTTGEMDDGGTPLTGYLYFEFKEGHEYNGGGSATTGLTILVDNFQQPVLIDANFQPAGDATQTTITYDTNVNRSKPEATQFIFGDGPTTAHIKRLRLTDSGGTFTGDITGDWNYGPATSATGYTLDQFWADALLKQYRRSARIMYTGVHSLEASAPYEPFMGLRIENTDSTNTPDYWWQSLEYRPASPWAIASGDWVEFVAGAGGNLLCEYSVQGSSVAALSLTLEQGIPCASGGTAIAPSVPSGTLFFTTGESFNSLIDADSLCRRDPDGTVTTLYTFTGTEPTALCLDEGSRYVFVVQGLKVWRFRYDGSDATNIYELGGYVRIGGIDLMTYGGTYNGYLFFIAVGSGGPGGVDDDVYRMDIDGANDAKVSNNQYTYGGGGIVCVSSTTVLVPASYSNGSIISYAAAGGNYAVVQNQQTFNNNLGLVVDVNGNRAWVDSNSDLRETNLSGAAYTDRTHISGTYGWWDETGDRIWFGTQGLRYRSGSSINGSNTQISPTTSGSSGTTTGTYTTNMVVAVQ